MKTRRGMRDARRLRSRRIRALLASGLVLGVGAGVTLAAWNDSEYGAASFTTGQFGIQGSTVTNPSVFSDHGAGAPATLAFAPSAQLSALAPGNTVYALFSVRTITPSVAGAVTMQGATLSGALTALQYGVKLIPAATVCDATSYAASTTVLVAAGSALTVGAAAQTLLANGGNQLNYCFAVSLPVGADNTTQNQSVTATWQFAAVSS